MSSGGRARGLRSSLSLAALEPADHRKPELGRTGAVDDAMVERERDVGDAAHDDLAGAGDRAVGDPTDAQDRDLGMVDERRLEEPGELARARDGEGRAAEVLRLKRSGPCFLGEALHIARELVDRPVGAAADDRYDEPVLGLDGDAE